MKKNIALIPLILCLALLLNIFFVPKEARAWPSVFSTAPSILTTGMTFGGVLADMVAAIGRYVATNIMQISVGAAKVAALLSVQAITQAIIGDGGGTGSGGVISNWNNYLYVSPQQKALAQMNSFFNTTSKGRLSSLNYEGLGRPNYDTFLVANANKAINENQNTFTTNIQEQVADPQKQLFSGGNMKGFMYYFQCANNVACYTMTAKARYESEFEKAQDIARNEQSQGFLPKKINGVIVQPAALLQNALLQIDQLGTQLIMSASGADGAGAFAQIAAGAGISIASRTLNYATATDQGKAEIMKRNSQFPFSLSYSTAGGFQVK